MASKRRYYRVDRGLPFVEMDDDDQDDSTGVEMTESNVRTWFWIVLATLTFGVALSVSQMVYTPTSDIGHYRVVFVSHGRLHAEDTATGERVSFPDGDLVKAALSGKIKRGDVIRR